MDTNMDGVALFLWRPTGEKRVEYLLPVLRKKFEEYRIETHQLDLSAPGAIQKLNETNDYFHKISFEKKHFVFSFDGTGFDLTLLVDGQWVDNVRYNVFSYLTKHPKLLMAELSRINSWYISLLTCSEDGVSYIEETYPHLEGTEMMVFPAFQGEYAGLGLSMRAYDILVLMDFDEEHALFLEDLMKKDFSLLVYGEGWEENGTDGYHGVTFVPEEERRYANKLDQMGQSRFVCFVHDYEDECADIDVISAMANGAVVLTEMTTEFQKEFLPDKEILLYDHADLFALPEQIHDVLMDAGRMAAIAEAGRKKAEKTGSLSLFAERILARCK